ncbi:MerR family transcriptional regulator [Rhizobium sp. CC-YZS058]|uniref:MerR family transcriptional regulator n=1 Tax=Rhizobium sp. CC-YZS058 TaxID=3042153 RepID=UPI002B05D224|nr:MerR family transcriptional regulator [Rhizobium sp. CC-YZS058]MEA3535283.1 MerR family transcriptional regulator [Rhizobium sp. CC-YZS058]
MDKSPDAFRTISEVADDLDLPQHVLRFWETRFTQIRPMKRGGGRRYYRPEDVDLLKGIRHLLYDHGYTIKGVQKLLKVNGNKFVAAIASGDLATVEALAAASNDDGAGERPAAGHAGPPHQGPRLVMNEDDQIVGRAKLPTSRRFFSFGGTDEAEVSIGKTSIGKEDRALLQEALYDLLECKRLLDQVR